MTAKIVAYWRSKKGNERNQNSDACAVFSNPKYSFVIIGDAAEKKAQSLNFLRDWMNSVLTSLKKEEFLNYEIVANTMKEEHKKLKYTSASAAACWCALFVDNTNEKIWTFACGDCRIGQECEDGTIEWLTPVHTLANWKGETFTREHASLPNRHTVTRILNSKRFTEPEILEVTYKKDAIWILATDGYWIEQKLEDIAPECLKDDASFFKMSNILSTYEITSDAENFQLIN